MAMEAPAEKLAYVVTLNTSGNGTPDALVVLDTDPESPDYGTVVGRLDMPNAGDELHHFGWNACSSALCPSTPHPHVERRYLLVPGLRSSRIHVVDVKDDPRAPKLVKVIEAEELARKSGYSRPHTSHCGPEGVYMNGLGSPSGDGPGGIFLLDHDTFDVEGQWEQDRGPQYLAYDFWWHLGHDTMITSEWGTPNMVEGGLDPSLLGQYGHQLHVWDLKTRKHQQAIDLGPEQQMVLELRPAHDPNKTYGFVGVVVSTADLSASIWTWFKSGSGWDVRKIITIPGRARRPGAPAPGAEALRRRAAAYHRHRPQLGRPLPLRVLLGDGRAAAVRRLRSLQPDAHRQRPAGRHRGPQPASRRRPRQRRATDGRAQPGRAAGVPHQLAVRVMGRAVLPGGDRRVGGEAGRRPDGRAHHRPGLLRPVRRRAAAPGAPAGWRRVLGLVLLPVSGGRRR
jgi:hypothetical protein